MYTQNATPGKQTTADGNFPGFVKRQDRQAVLMISLMAPSAPRSAQQIHPGVDPAIQSRGGGRGKMRSLTLVGERRLTLKCNLRYLSSFRENFHAKCVRFDKRSSWSMIVLQNLRSSLKCGSRMWLASWGCILSPAISPGEVVGPKISKFKSTGGPLDCCSVPLDD